MTFLSRLRSFRLRSETIRKFLTIALIAPLLQVVQIAVPSPASAAVFTAGYTGSTKTYVVPAGVTSLTISIRGGTGGTGGNDSHGGGGPGRANVVTGTITVTPGESISYGVGQGGANGTGCYGNATGGNGGNGNFAGLGNYSGGRGANAGPYGCSGSGAGGGAATVISGTFGTIIAAGSGGGSGGDNCVNGNAGRAYSNGTGSSTGGEGATLPNRDGGGGGGGGGGNVGGIGGTTYEVGCDEFIGYGGQSGSNLTITNTSASTDSPSSGANGSLSFTYVTPPNAPTTVTAVPASTRATVSWISGGTSGAAISGYLVTASNGATCTVASALITTCTFAAGTLTNGVSYTFTVKADSSAGYSPSSSASSAVTPNAFTLTYDSNTATSGAAPADLSSPYPTGSPVTVRANSNLIKTNYTFTGWNTKADGTGTGRAATGSATFTIETNTVLYAQWTPVTYTLTYNANSGTGTLTDSSSPYIFNSTVTVKANSTLARTNYAFTGWNTRANGVGGNAYAATGSVTFTLDTNTVLYAQWAQYVLTYNSNSGSGLPPTSLTSGGVITLGGSGTLTRAGYYFDGWNTQADGLGSSYTATGSYTLTGVTTLYAKWSRYKITYDTGTATSGTVPLVQSGYGAVTLSSNSGSLAKADNYWDGWTRSSDGTGTKLSGSFDLSGNVTLYPRWDKYTLSYNRGTADPGGSVPGSATGYGNKTTAQNTGSLAKSNFAFTGWNTASDGSGRYYAANSTINLDTNTVLYPYFSKFTITYDTGTATSGSPPAPQLGASGVTLATNSGSLAKTDYYWAGWTTSRNGTGTILTSPYNLSGNITLYPRWSQYTITYDMTGYTTAGTPFTTLGVGNTTLAGSAPGYISTLGTLGGWTTASGGGTFYNLGATFNITSSVTLYAKWLTLPGSTLTISNPTLLFPLTDSSGNFPSGGVRVAIRVTETAGSHSTRSFTVSVTGTNCSSEGSAVTTNDSNNTGGTLDSGFFVKASGIASCSVTITRPSDANYGASRSNTEVFQFYPKNQVTPLLVDTTTVLANVGTPIPLGMLGSNIGNGSGAVSYAAYGNNCFITTSGSNYFLNATLPTQCQVIVTRAAWQQWAIATSQKVATFTFVALAQTGFTVTSKSVDFGTTVSLFTTGGNGNGAVSYSAFGSGCAIADVNKLTATNAGTCTVVAYKSASGAYKGQTSAAATFTFTPISQSPITITDNSSAANAVSPNVITLGIRGGTGSGAVSFGAAPTPNCQITRIDSFTATLSAAVTGKCTVTAYKSASNGYTGITSSPASYSFGIAPLNNLVLVSAGGVTSTLLTASINLSVTGQVVGGGAINFARFNNNSCYFTNVDTSTGTVTLKSTAVGSCNVQVTQAASGAYLSASSGLVTFTFTGGVQSPLTLTFSNPDTSTTTTSGSTMNMVTTGGSGSGVFSYSVQNLNGANCGAVVRANPSDTVTSVATISSTSPGICQVTVVKSGDSLYSYISKTTNFTFVGTPQPTLTLSASPTSAPALTNVRVTLGGGSGNGAISFTVTGGCTQNSQSGNTVNITSSSPSSCFVSATKAADGTIASATTYPGLVVNFTKAVQSNLVTKVDNLSSDYDITRAADLSYLISTTGGSGTGDVTFAAYGNGNCKLDTSTAGMAILTSAFQTATCSVVATKGGDSIYGPVSAAAVSLSFTAAWQSDLTLTGDATSAAVNANITITVAGGNGSGALKFTANNSSGGSCVITPGNTDTTTVTRAVTSTSVGNCSVTVVKSGTGIYGTKVATSSNFNFGSTQAPLTLIPETNTVPVAGDPFILILRGGNGGGALTWYGGGCAASSYDLATGKITIRSDSEALTCNVSVSRAGAGGYFGASSNAQSVTFTPATQDSLNIFSAPTSVGAGETITVTLTGGSGTGAYNFALYQTGSDCVITKSGGTALVYRATAGNCSIQGLRAGDKKYKSALSATIGLAWGQRAQTIPLVISNDPTYASAGETITLTTVGGEGEGLVTFQVIGDYNPLCVLSGDRGQYLFKAAYGTCMIRATKAATLVYAQQRSQNIVFTFFGTTAQTPLAIDVSASTASLGSTISLSTTGGSVPGSASYVITGGTGTGTITGTTLSATSAGTLTVVATKQGNSQYASVVSPPATFTFTG